MLLFPEGPAFETGTLQNTEPGFPGLRGERGPKGNPGLKGVKGDFVPVGFFVPRTPWKRLSGKRATRQPWEPEKKRSWILIEDLIIGMLEVLYLGL